MRNKLIELCIHDIKDHSFPSMGKTIEFGKFTLKLKEKA